MYDFSSIYKGSLSRRLRKGSRNLMTRLNTGLSNSSHSKAIHPSIPPRKSEAIRFSVFDVQVGRGRPCGQQCPVGVVPMRGTQRNHSSFKFVLFFIYTCIPYTQNP
jgi:hypothetical protein